MAALGKDDPIPPLPRRPASTRRRLSAGRRGSGRRAAELRRPGVGGESEPGQGAGGSAPGGRSDPPDAAANAPSHDARPPADAAWVAAAIERWFPAHRRDLPWRRRRTPYRVLVSEFMLQQTQVSRVAERYPLFLKRFPSIRSLAEAPLEAVLAQWQGLGYYRRARLLHAAAARIVAEHGGRVPSDPALLQTIPGIGRYTAGAIASIGFGARAPIVDGNVSRVLLRLHGRALASDDPDAVNGSWREAESLVLASGDPAALNEGLMELGATICTPMAPRCESCPLGSACSAFAQGLAKEIPLPKRAPARQRLDHHAVLVQRGERLLLSQRPPTGPWAGLWGLPGIDASPRSGRRAIAAMLGVSPEAVEPVGSFVQLTTHREVRVHLHRLGACELAAVPDGCRWATAEVRAGLPMGSLQRRSIELATGGLRRSRAAASASTPPPAPQRGPRSPRRSRDS